MKWTNTVPTKLGWNVHSKSTRKYVGQVLCTALSIWPYRPFGTYLVVGGPDCFFSSPVNFLQFWIRGMRHHDYIIFTMRLFDVVSLSMSLRWGPVALRSVWRLLEIGLVNSMALQSSESSVRARRWVLYMGVGANTEDSKAREGDTSRGTWVLRLRLVREEEPDSGK